MKEALYTERVEYLKELGLETKDKDSLYTLQGIFDKIPCHTSCKKEQFDWGIGYIWYYGKDAIIMSDDLLLAAYDMLIWCLKNNKI